jgi:hypothetical protein
MRKIAGLFKELASDEDVVFQTKNTTPTIFLKGAQVKKWRGLESTEVPVAYSMVNLYLTNKRLMFLIHSEIEAPVLGEKKGSRLPEIAGTWFEIPVPTIDNVEIVHKDIRKDEEIKKLVSSLSKKDTVELVQLIYNKQKTTGRMKDRIDTVSKKIGLKKIVSAYDKLYVMEKELYTSLVKQLKLEAEKERIEKLKRRLKQARKKERKLRRT